TAGNVLTGRTISWTSSNAAVATVSGTGLVSGVAAGSATITATSEGRSGQAQVTVAAPSAPGTVTNLAAGGATDSSVTLSFNEVSAETGRAASYGVRCAVALSSWG